MSLPTTLARAALALALLPAAAKAAYVAPGATVVSASRERLELADDHTLAAAISADGRFAAIQTRARNLFPDDVVDPDDQYFAGGVFRRDLQSGALELVALGELRNEADDTTARRGAQAPAISADGRYVVFSTGEGLVPADMNGNIDVYVRDMAKGRGELGAYDLISARDGGDVPASWGPSNPDRPGLNLGAEVTARAAISNDGNTVVFRTLQESDLPAEAGATTPPGQVVVRDREANTTTLLTRDRTTDEPVGGAIGPAGISGDGTTVVWSGRMAPRQTRFQPGEGEDNNIEHFLWLRVSDGPGAPTRRITGLSDIDDPACDPGTVIEDSPNPTGPCYGPLAQREGFVGGIVNQLPAMSADGRTLVFLTIASARAQVAGGIGHDLYVTSMAPGATRKGTTVELTREGQGNTAVNAPLESVALSQDGRWATVQTGRTQFVLPALRQLTAPRPVAGSSDLYLVDLQGRTIERILRGRGGDDPNGPVVAPPSMSADGRRILFTSLASNFFNGDANERIDAFVVTREDSPPAAPPDPEPPAPDLLPVVEPPIVQDPASTRRLRVVLKRGKRGAVRLVVRAPGPGRVSAVARGRLPRADGKLTGKARRLGSTARTAKKAGDITLTLGVLKSYRSALRRAGELAASTTITFTPRSDEDATLTRRLNIVFRTGR